MKEARMKSLTCEVCQGRDFTKDGDEYVCNGCGTRYTPAEVLSILLGADEESTTQRTSTNNSSDDQSQTHEAEIWKLTSRAYHAKEAGNYYESESYWNKVLALDEDNYEVLCLKAEVVAAQTTLDDDRTLEAIGCYRKAMDAAPQDKREWIRKQSEDHVAQAVANWISFVADRYAATASADDGDAVLKLPRFADDRASRLRRVTGGVIAGEQLHSAVAIAMRRSAESAWNNHILPAYQADAHRDKKAMDEFVSGGDKVIAILLCAIDYCNDASCAQSCYKLMITAQQRLINAHSMRKDGIRWVRAYSLTEEDKQCRRRDINDWQVLMFNKGGDAQEVANTTSTAHRVAYAEPPQAVTSESDKKPSIWHRDLSWKGAVALACFARFLSLVNSSQAGAMQESFVWLSLAIAFAGWWYEKG